MSASGQEGVGSRIMQFISDHGLFCLCIAGVISLYITSFVKISKALGSADSWTSIQGALPGIWGPTLAGTLLLCIAALIYFTQDSVKANYFSIIISCLSLGLAYSSLAVSSITVSS